MYNITVGRLEDHPEAQGVIKPADDSWQLVIDNEGFPHLWLRAKGEDGSMELIPLDSFLPEGADIKSLMLSTFGGEITDESELAQAQEEWAETKAKLSIPDPV